MISHPLEQHIRYLGSRLQAKGPSILFYYLTLRCNSKCGYCHVPSISSPADAKLEDVIENLHCAKKMGITHLIPTGGEPLLFTDLKPVLEAAKRLGFHVTLTTNGLNYSKRAYELVGLIDNLEFSLPAADPQTYYRERGVNGYTKVIDALKLAIDLGEKPAVSATITNNTISQIDSLVELTQDLGVMLLIKPAFRYFGNRSLDWEETRHFRRFENTRNVWYNDAFIEFVISGGNRTDSPRCRALVSTIAISPNNGLHLPCFHHVQEELPIDGNLERAMRSSRVQAYRQNRGRWSFCEGCYVICYFEDAFLWPPGRLIVKDLLSRIRWLDCWRRYH
jgi:MoaA/NifB/PqqE/SkfB family radical SAM enzyme